LLFDERPKENIEDLYDRNRELKLLIKLIRECKPLILILGLRRTGKTSLLKVALNQLNLPHIVIDCRVFEENISISYNDIIRVFEKALNNLVRRRRKIINFLKSIKAINIAGLEIKFTHMFKRRISLIEVFEKLNEYCESENQCMVIAFDEAQELAKARGIRFLPIIAYSYDNFPRLTFIFTGSKIGLLYRFLKIDDPKSPIYGRVRHEIFLKNFTREMSLDFLRKGFREANMMVDEKILEKAVEKLDGIVGWLTYFGSLSIQYKASEKIIQRVLEEGSRIVLNELENFFRIRYIARKRYQLILKRIAIENASWIEIKDYIEVKDRPISDSNLALLLNNLIDAGFIEKKDKIYRITDPVLKYAVNKYF